MAIFSTPKVSVLVVCTANICRSPMAHGLLRQLCDARGFGKQVLVDSAGTQVGMKGQRPDPRAQSILGQAGLDISGLRTRPVEDRDFERFDYILGMDQGHLRDLQKRCPEEHHARLGLIMGFAEGQSEGEVPDPYFGNEAGFLTVFEMLQRATVGFVDTEIAPRLE